MLSETPASLGSVFRSKLRLTYAIVGAVLLLAAYFGRHANMGWLVLLGAGIGAALLLTRPSLGSPVLVLVALVGPLEIGTGTDVKLNLAFLLTPVLLALWLLDMVRRKHVSLAPTAANAPLILFLASGLFSLLIGTATWDPHVTRSSGLLPAQLGQWAIFALSAGAFWLAGNVIRDEAWLRRLTSTFLIVGGGVAILWVFLGADSILSRVTTIAFIRAPFWMLLSALAGGQLLFNRSLTLPRRAFLAAVLLAAFVYAFIVQRGSIANWVGVAAALSVLVWLRFPRLRWLLIVLVVALAALGILFPSIYSFAGGDTEWIGSGASRLVLIQRVVEVTMRNPLTGLGPAAYRAYAGMTPLAYQRAYWPEPQVNSHNNYVDLFAHTGILGLGLFAWFVLAFARTAARLRARYRNKGFAGGYLNGVLAAGAGALVLMLFADWILPHVYNIGIPGFQASVLVWLFLGGVVALENMKGGVGEQESG